MKFSERIFEHVFSAHVDGKVISSDSFVESLELLSEKSAFDVKVEYTGVVYEDCKWSVR